MALLYLILLTLFGFFTFLCLLVLIFATKAGSTKFVFFIIFAIPTFLFYRSYKRAKKKQKDLIDADLEKDRVETENLYNSNQETISAYSKEIDEILISKYHFLAGFRPRNPLIKDAPYISEVSAKQQIDTKMFSDGKTPHDAAKTIYHEVVKHGDDGSPEIFTEAYSTKTLPKYYKFNKAFFGSYNPTSKMVKFHISIFAFLFLMFYGTPQILFGPNHDIFIPSKEWKSISTILVFLFSIALAFFLLRFKPIFKIASKHGKSEIFLHKLILVPLIFMCCYFSIQVGLGKALNEILGVEKVELLQVQKDSDTRKRTGRYSSSNAYCVKIISPYVTIGSEEYCIQKQHYDQVTTTEPMEMMFHGTSSYFGFRIDGYYQGYRAPPKLDHN